MSRYCTNCGNNSFGHCRVFDIFDINETGNKRKCFYWVSVGVDIEEYCEIDAVTSDIGCIHLYKDLRPAEKQYV